MEHYTAVIMHPTVRRHYVDILATDYQDAVRKAEQYCEEYETPDSMVPPTALVYCAEDDDEVWL